MKVRAVLEVIGVQHRRSHDGPQTRVTMVGGGSEQIRLIWTIPEWAPIARGMTFEVDITPLSWAGGVQERREG